VRRCLEIYEHLSALPERIGRDLPQETRVPAFPGQDHTH
jgi:hypothetical protein